MSVVTNRLVESIDFMRRRAPDRDVVIDTLNRIHHNIVTNTKVAVDHMMSSELLMKGAIDRRSLRNINWALMHQFEMLENAPDVKVRRLFAYDKWCFKEGVEWATLIADHLNLTTEDICYVNIGFYSKTPHPIQLSLWVSKPCLMLDYHTDIKGKTERGRLVFTGD